MLPSRLFRFVAVACMFEFAACSSTESLPRKVSIELEVPRAWRKQFVKDENVDACMEAAMLRKRIPERTNTGLWVGLNDLTLAGVRNEGPYFVYANWDVAKCERDKALVTGIASFCTYPTIEVWPVLRWPVGARFKDYDIAAEVRFKD